MEEEGYSWPLLGVVNHDGLIQYFQGMAGIPLNAVNADVTAVSHQGLTYFYARINRSYSTQTNELGCISDCREPLQAWVRMGTTAWHNELAEVKTWCCWFKSYFQMTAHPGNCDGGGYFWKSPLKLLQPPLSTRDLRLETANLFLPKVEHLKHHCGVVMGAT